MEKSTNTGSGSSEENNHQNNVKSGSTIKQSSQYAVDTSASVEVAATVRSINTSESTIGSDVLFRCDFPKAQTLLRVSGWVRDDGQIYLPLANLVDSISLGYREPNANSQLGLSSSSYQQHFGKFHPLFSSIFFPFPRALNFIFYSRTNIEY